jgi:hypothetical protein
MMFGQHCYVEFVANFSRGDSGSQTGKTGSNDYYVVRVFFHRFSPSMNGIT